ncbi:replication factor C large subunit [Candidatus Woesearchaeota archaeon]|nr:replication factor C large subunit [Candidatus Woesearchaeota archaeon]
MWSEKYKPKNSGEIFGAGQVVERLKDFIVKYKKGTAIMLCGKSGVGKTCLVHALAKELGLEILEINASDVRNKEQINSVVGNSMRQMSLFSKGKVILVDEIDGLSGMEDRGGASELAGLIKGSCFPMILTANDPYQTKLKDLKSKCEILEVKTPSYLTVKNLLKHVSDKEGLRISDDLLKDLALRADGDFRTAIISLQSLAAGAEISNIDQKETRGNIMDSLRLVLKGKNTENVLGAYDNIDMDYGDVMLWLEENIPKEYKNAEDLAQAFEMLSRADVFNGRISRWQYWRFLAYIYDYLGAGVALAKKEKYQGFTAYGPSRRILKLWQAKMRHAKRDSIALKIASYTHCSKKRVLQDSYPYLKNALTNSDLALEVGLDQDEINFLKQ